MPITRHDVPLADQVLSPELLVTAKIHLPLLHPKVTVMWCLLWWLISVIFKLPSFKKYASHLWSSTKY